MNREDLIYFRNNVANPAMKRLFEATEISEGLCCINSVSISFFDGRSYGVENEVKASGLIYRDGNVEEYSFCEQDISFDEFAEAHKDCYFLLDGELHFYDQLDEIDLSTVLRSYDICARICPELEGFKDLNLEGGSSDIGIKFEKMSYLFAGDDYLKLFPETGAPDMNKGAHGDGSLQINHEKLQEYIDEEMIIEFDSPEECMSYFNTYDGQNFKFVDEMKNYQGEYGFGIGGKWYHISFDEALDVREKPSLDNQIQSASTLISSATPVVDEKAKDQEAER